MVVVPMYVSRAGEDQCAGAEFGEILDLGVADDGGNVERDARQDINAKARARIECNTGR